MIKPSLRVGEAQKSHNLRVEYITSRVSNAHSSGDSYGVDFWRRQLREEREDYESIED